MTKLLKMTALILTGCCLTGLGGRAQSPQPQDKVPALSTADKNSLSDAEKAKQEANTAFQKALELEMAVIREWNAAHPGFHVNPSTFAVEKDVEVKK